MPDPRAVIALIIIIFILFSPDPQDRASPAARSRFVDAIVEEHYALDVVNTSRYGDFDPPAGLWLNLTGLRNDSAYVWESLRDIKERARILSQHALGNENARTIDGDGLDSVPPLYSNVTGVLNGGWVRSPISTDIPIPQLNLSEYAPIGPFGRILLDEFGRNLTGTQGFLKVRLSEPDLQRNVGYRVDTQGEEIPAVRAIGANIEVQPGDGEGSVWNAQVQGVHFVDSGSILMTTTSDKFAGIFALPHLSLSQFQYDHSQRLFNRTLGYVIDRQEDGSLHSTNPWTSGGDGTGNNAFTNPACELVIYMQQQPDNMPQSGSAAGQSGLLKFMEDEMRFPTGAFLPAAHDMQFSMLAFSPDCGYVLESKGPPDFAPQEGTHLVGPKVEVEYNQGRHHLMTFAIVLTAQLWLLTNQMREASTPSTRSRISFYTIGMLSFGDGFTTMTMALVSIFVPNLWVLVMATCFLAFLSVSFFGMRFLMDIWGVQAPERERRERQRRADAQAEAAANATSRPNAATQIPIITPAGVDALPLPATARRPVDTGATPVIVPSDQDEPTDVTGQTPNPTGTQAAPSRISGFGALYTRFYLLLLFSLFLSLNATSWPATIRRTYFTVLALLYLSFWVPQINRNAYRNCRHALRWDFVIGQSILRLTPFAYFYGYKSNVLFADVDLIDLAVLVGWVWVQVVMLVSQEIIGPRWFIQSAWVPPAYDYHPLLREDEEGGNLPIGFSQATAIASEDPSVETKPGDGHEKGKKLFDCAICMQDLEVSVAGPDGPAEGGLAGASSILSRRAYMVTPCRHIFHSQCLEGWMKYRLQCPICRDDLPPL